MGDELTGSDGQAVLPFDDGSAGRVIRREWHRGRWFFSVVDVIAALTDSDSPSTYWGMMKRRLATDEGFAEVFTKCEKLKLRSPLDGKRYATDAADVETMLRIVQSVPSPKAEPIRQWLARVGAQRLEEVAASLDEDQRRQLLRGEVADRTATLNDVAKIAGVATSRDFAIFTDWGYKGLYAGETARDIATRKVLAKGERVLDWMGSEELAANFFRITQTEAKLRREGVNNKAEANATHFQVGRAVRKTIEELGGTMPEQLPTPPESIKQVEQREQRRIEQATVRQRQPALLGEGESDSSITDDESTE